MSVMGSLVLTLLVSALAITLISFGPFDENRKMCLELLQPLLLKLDLKAVQTCAVNTARQTAVMVQLTILLNMIIQLRRSIGISRAEMVQSCGEW